MRKVEKQSVDERENHNLLCSSSPTHSMPSDFAGILLRKFCGTAGISNRNLGGLKT